MPVSVQNHIHMALLSSDVSSNVALATWAIIAESYNPQPAVYVNAVRTFGGKLRVFAAKDSGGSVVVSNNISFQLRLRAVSGETVIQREDRLRAMFGKVIYFLPPLHDSAAHGTGIKAMLLRAPNSWVSLDPGLNNQVVSLFLEDTNT